MHNLPPPYNSVATLNRLLQQHGISLNDSGGIVKQSPDGLLLQSSSVADMVQAEFDDGQGGTETHPIAGSYIEFAERRVLPAFQHLPATDLRREHRREGFEAGNADKIFESTYTEQTHRIPKRK